MATHKILIVEDEDAIRQLLVFALQGEGLDCRLAASVPEAQARLNEGAPDLILLDWMLPGLSGLEFTRRLKRDSRYDRIPIILLTAKGEEGDKVSGLDSGADDYITKPFSARELVARVRAALRRSAAPAGSDVLTAGALRLDLRTHRLTAGEQVLAASPTEFRLLAFFMQHPERAFSRGQLLDAVWTEALDIEERTVDVHVRRLRGLLENSGLENMIQTVRGVGYRFSAQ